MKTTAIIMMVITIISKVMGLLRESVKAYFYGTGNIATAFVMAQTIPVFIFNFIQMGITTGYIPSYNRILKKDGKEAAHKFTSNLGNVAVVIAIILVIIIEIFAGPIVKLFAPGFDAETFNLTVQFTRITSISIIASALACVYKSYLNARNNFIVPNLQGFVMNTFIIIALAVSFYTKKPILLAVGLCFAIAIQYVIYIPAVKASRFNYTRGIDFKDSNLREMLVLALPVIFGVAIYQINILIDKSLSSLILQNGPTILDYATRLNDFVNGIVIVSIGTVVYPQLSKQSANHDMKSFKDTILSSLSMISVLVIPAMVGLIIFSSPIVKLVFERGQFTPEDTLITSQCLQLYAIGLIGVAVRDIISKSFYAMKDTKTPTKNSVLMVIVNVGASIGFSYLMGIKGLALGTAIASIFGAVVLTLKLRKKIGAFKNVRKTIVEILKMTIASAVMGAGSYFVFTLLSKTLSSSLSLLIAILVAVIIYAFMVLILRVEEIRLLIMGFRKKIHKK